MDKKEFKEPEVVFINMEDDVLVFSAGPNSTWETYESGGGYEQYDLYEGDFFAD